MSTPSTAASADATPGDTPPDRTVAGDSDAATSSDATTSATEAAEQPDFVAFLKHVLGGPTLLGAIGGALAVWLVGGVLSRELWGILRWPAERVQSRVAQRDCTPYQPGTFDMYLCSARVGFFQVLGPFVVVLTSLLFRRPITAAIGRLRATLPAGRSLVSPVVTTLLFTMAYSQIHRDTSYQEGVVSQTDFPALIGVATFLIGRFGPTLVRRWSGPLTVRDRIPLLLRAPLAMLIPILLSYVLTNQDRVTDPARKEQIVILVSLAVGYLAVVPRSGRLQLPSLAGRRLRGGTP